MTTPTRNIGIAVTSPAVPPPPPEGPSGPSTASPPGGPPPTPPHNPQTPDLAPGPAGNKQVPPPASQAAAGATVAMHPMGQQNNIRPSLTTAFLRTLGAQALDELKRAFTKKPVVAIAGVSFTGKSTLSTELAKKMGGRDDSTGRIFRTDAAQKGLSPAEWSKQVGGIPGYDVKLDYRGCTIVAAGESEKKERVTVFEARLAAALGNFLRGLGRTNIKTVFLTCSPRERVLRCAAREGEKVISGARAHLEKILPDLPTAEFGDYLTALDKLNDPVATAVRKSLTDEVARADRDRQRLLAEYGVDIADTSGYDIVVDTTRIKPDQVMQQVLAGLPKDFVAG